jgi:uncharacterized protein
MIEVIIDSVRVSLMSQHRVVVLKDSDSDRYLPIWIGPFEADAITMELQNVEAQRPLTHDLLKRVVTLLGAQITHVIINDLQNDTFYARIFLEVNGKEVEVDARPSDAIALAVRVKAPVYVTEEVMDRAAISPEDDIRTSTVPAADTHPNKKQVTEDQPQEEDLEAFRDFIEGLDLDDLGSESTAQDS